jgi:hypothetical protein
MGIFGSITPPPSVKKGFSVYKESALTLNSPYSAGPWFSTKEKAEEYAAMRNCGLVVLPAVFTLGQTILESAYK